MERELDLMVVAGEASGDAHAARLIEALERLEPTAQFRFFGAAGPRMRSAGVEAVVKADELSVVGLMEIGRALPRFLRAKRALGRAAAARRPAAAVLVDFPDFNLKFARDLKKLGIPVVYYISPQLWAWRSYRVSAIRRYVDLLLTILPFEAQWYASRGFDRVSYVGNPLAGEVRPTSTKEEFCARFGLDPSRPIVSLLPGSRQKEISRILPLALDAASVVHENDRNVQFLIAAAGDRSRTQIEKQVDALGTGPSMTVVANATYDALAASDAAAITSGTATLEAGIVGTPMVIVYKTSATNYKLLEPLIDVPHYGLINLIAGERVATELIQHELTPQKLAAEILRLLKPEVNTQMRAQLKSVAAKLGEGGASDKAALEILNLLHLGHSERAALSDSNS